MKIKDRFEHESRRSDRTRKQARRCGRNALVLSVVAFVSALIPAFLQINLTLEYYQLKNVFALAFVFLYSGAAGGAVLMTYVSRRAYLQTDQASPNTLWIAIGLGTASILLGLLFLGYAEVYGDPLFVNVLR